MTHPDDVPACLELTDQLFHGQIPFFRTQKRYVKKTGETLWVNVTGSTIRDKDDKPLHGLAMIEDITEMKRAQEEAQVRQKLESVGALAGGIAHDFNNLLGAVQAQTELALSELDAGVSCREELKTIGAVAMRGSEIVRQLMIYAGRESATAGPVDLSRIVEEMLSLLEISVTKHAVIKVDLDPDLPAIVASAAHIRQIVMNLITNASDAIGDRDGIIRVITRRVSLPKESAASSQTTPADGGYVELEVSDSGPGISPETQAKIFDPFFTTKSAGRGLGLAVVQGIVRTLGGAISFTSEPNRGTAFRVVLPCTEVSPEAIRHAKSEGGEFPVSDRNGTVLVVEDETSLRQPTGKLLRKTGFEVLEAADGNSAMDVLRTQGTNIDVILLDMTIPGASSHEIIAEATKIKPGIRLILTSAYSREGIDGSIDNRHKHSFIRKPFLLKDLVNSIRECLAS
jgi:signal transduction histidine kinase